MSSQSVAATKRVRIKNAYAGASKDLGINTIQDEQKKFLPNFDSSDPSYIIAYAGASNFLLALNCYNSRRENEIRSLPIISDEAFIIYWVPNVPPN